MVAERRDAKRNRRIADRLVQAMFMAMDEGAVARNGNGEIVAVNPAAENILGLPATEWIGRSAADFAQALNLVREDGTPLSWELHPATRAVQTGIAQRNVLMGAHRPDGTLVWISANALPLVTNGESGPCGVVTTFRDVTERKRTEDALWFVAQRGWMDGAENFFDALAQFLGNTLGMDYAVIKRLDEDSGHAETIAMYAKGAIVPNRRFPLQGTPHKEVLERRFCVFPQGIRQLFPEDTLLAELGTECYAGLVLWDSVGKPIGLVSVMCSRPLRQESPVSNILHVVAPRVAAELERERDDRLLRQSEREFRTLAENMPDNVVRYDRQARVRYFNPAIEASIAPEVLPVLGESPVETFPGIDALAGYQHAIEQVIATGTPVELEFQAPDPRREMRDHQVRVVAERDGNGEIVGALAIGQDISERKRAEKYEQFRGRTLELLSGAASLPDILEGIARGLEELDPEMICSILLLDSQGKHFCKGIGPSLPDSYNAGLKGLEIGVGVGCCGTTAATGQRVIADDLTTHPYWAPYQELVAMAGVSACWSEPIRASTGQVLGTFAVYHRQAHSPTLFDIALIEKSTHLVSIAIERKRAEEALRASEQEFRTLAENLPDILVRYDSEGRRTYANRALERSFGLTADRLIGKTVWDNNPTGMEMMEAYQRALGHTLATGERSEFEVQAALPGGDVRTGLCFIAAERTADGRISGAIAIVRDITGRKRLESEVRRREREFRSLAENSPDAIFRYDRDCRRIYANPTSSVMSGHPVESLVGATPRDGHLLGAEDAARLTAGIRRVFASGEPGCVDTVSVDRDGRRRHYQVLLVPEPDENGSVATVLGIAHDMTAIRDTERRMTDFVANLPGFAFTFRLSPEGHGSFPFASPGIKELFGLKPEDVKEDWAPGLAVTHPDDVPRILATMAESARTMTPYHVEIRACPPGSLPRWLEVRSIPVRQADGSVLWHGIMLDIDERKRNEAELEEHRHHLEQLVEDRTRALSIAKEAAEAATRAKSHFLAAASHDLRQPLQAIRLFNDALAMSGLNERQKKIGNSLAKSVISLNELLNDLLDLSRLDAGTIEPQPAVIQAEDLLEAIGGEFDAVCQERDLRLKLVCPQRGLALFCDDNLLLTLLRNLVSNAVKYTRRGGVLMGIRRRGDRALIQVWDTGIGIPAEQRDSIFEEYFQIGNPERDRAKGVGLGLAIVRRLSKLLDVGVRCRSRVGKGSVFEVSVPLADKADMAASLPLAVVTPETTALSRLAGKRIVAIDDDGTSGDALKLALELEGAQVILFDRPEDALGSAEAIGADYYISDYRLPGMNGLQLLDAIQENSAEPIKAVMLTGNVSPDQIAVMRSSRWKVVFKPVALTDLLSALDACESVH